MQVQPVRRRRIIISCNICQTPTVYINTIYTYCKKWNSRNAIHRTGKSSVCMCVCVCSCGQVGWCGCNIDKRAFIIHSKRRSGGGAAAVTNVFSLLTVRWVLSKIKCTNTVIIITIHNIIKCEIRRGRRRVVRPRRLLMNAAKHNSFASEHATSDRCNWWKTKKERKTERQQNTFSFLSLKYDI